MAQRAHVPPTFEELDRLEEGVRGEIIFGQLETHAAPRPRHVASASRLGARLGRAFDEGDGGPGGWWILDEPQVRRGGHALIPDLAGWRVERMPELPTEAYFSLAPDWVCELSSPSTAKRDRGVKMDAYAAIGVACLWLIEVDERLLEAFRCDDGRWLRLGAHVDDACARVPPFDELELGALWRPPARRGG